MQNLVGIIGGLILLGGAAHKDHNPKRKNLIFAIGNVLMFAYALLGFIDGGSLLFVLLQIMVNLSSLCMLLNVPDKIDTPLVSLTGLGLAIYAGVYYYSPSTLLFIAGLILLSLGFSLDYKKQLKNVFLVCGSLLIAYFAWLMQDMVFFGLNSFFALFSLKHLLTKKS